MNESSTNDASTSSSPVQVLTHHYCEDCGRGYLSFTEGHAHFICSLCGDYHADSELNLTQYDGNVCDECNHSHYFECDVCGEVLRNNAYGSDGRCERCSEEDDAPSGVTRPYSRLDMATYQSRVAGDVIRSSRKFSAEIECYYPSGSTMREVARELPREIGIEYDGSLNNNGIEFQTPKLAGKAGEDAITSMCQILIANRFKVDNKAGLHVHLDAKDFIPSTKTKNNAEALRRLWAFYLDIDDVLLSFLPRSRRSNRYCAPLSNEYHRRELEQCCTLQDIEKYWYKTKNLTDIKNRKRGKDSSRYVGINLHSLLADGHIEIRYHSGTINPDKILEWVNLHQKILDGIVRGTLAYPTQGLRGAPLEEKTEALFHALGLTNSSREFWRGRQKKFLTTGTNED